MLFSGNLRHRITIERALYDVDGDGKTTRLWEVIAGDVAVSITTLPTGDNAQGDIRERQTRHQIMTRYRDNIYNKMRAIWGTRRLYFEHVHDPTNRRRELRIIANEPAFEPVEYSRGNLSSPLLAVRVNNTHVEAATNGSATFVGRSVDWLIDAADFIVAGSQITPYMSDRIIVGDGTYAAQPLNGELWHYSDPDHTFVRVHTIQVAA